MEHDVTNRMDLGRRLAEAAGKEGRTGPVTREAPSRASSPAEAPKHEPLQRRSAWYAGRGSYRNVLPMSCLQTTLSVFLYEASEMPMQQNGRAFAPPGVCFAARLGAGKM